VLIHLTLLYITWLSRNDSIINYRMLLLLHVFLLHFTKQATSCHCEFSAEPWLCSQTNINQSINHFTAFSPGTPKRLTGTTTGFLWAGCPSCHSTYSVKPPQEGNKYIHQKKFTVKYNHLNLQRCYKKNNLVIKKLVRSSKQTESETCLDQLQWYNPVWHTRTITIHHMTTHQ